MTEGSYLIDRIRSRCIECGDCLLWTGAGAEKGPLMRVPGSRSLVPVRRVVLQAAGRWKDGQLATNSCGRPSCVAEWHAIGVDRTTLLKMAVQRTAYHKRVSRNAKISARARPGGKLSPQVVAEIRSSDLSTRALARLHGVTQSTVQDAKSGKTYRDYSSPYISLEARA